MHCYACRTYMYRYRHTAHKYVVSACCTFGLFSALLYHQLNTCFNFDLYYSVWVIPTNCKHASLIPTIPIPLYGLQSRDNIVYTRVIRIHRTQHLPNVIKTSKINTFSLQCRMVSFLPILNHLICNTYGEEGNSREETLLLLSNNFFLCLPIY